MESIVPFVALGLSAMTLIATQLWAMRTARTDVVDQLSTRVTVLEKEVKEWRDRASECEQEKSNLRAELIDVYRKLAAGQPLGT